MPLVILFKGLEVVFCAECISRDKRKNSFFIKGWIINRIMGSGVSLSNTVPTLFSGKQESFKVQPEAHMKSDHLCLDPGLEAKVSSESLWI